MTKPTKLIINFLTYKQMKTMKRFTYLMVVAIVGLALASCDKKNEVETQNAGGNYNGQTVKSQFIINLPSKSGSSAKKMKATQVQANEGTDPAFQGMDNIILIPFAAQADITGTDTRLSQNIDKSTGLAGFQSYDSDPSGADIAHAKIYENIKMPLGTYSFLFYGKAVQNTLDDSETDRDGYNQSDKFKFGVVHTEGLTNKTPATFKFKPVQIYPAGTEDAKATAIMTYLTSIANVTDAAPASKTWAEGGNNTEQGWKDLYETFINHIGSEYKPYAASSASVQAMVTDLYGSVVTQADVNTMAAAIKAAILNATYVTNVAACGADASVMPTFADAINGYPSNFTDNAVASLGLPDGAAALKWNNTSKEFQIEGTYEWVAANGSGNMDVALLTKYIYAPALYYYANSQIFTKEEPQKDNYVTAAAGAANSDAAWEQILTTLYGKGGVSPTRSVVATTQSVAIEKPINYGVARMDVKVKANAATLNDSKNRPHLLGTGIKPTGVLIGGQGEVGFDFTPAADGDYVIWDPIIDKNTTTVGTDYPAYPNNYTLAFETRPATKVRVAVEFENNMGDFYGVGGQLIPQRTKFYVIAELDPADIGAVKNGNDKGNVFRQDFATLVKLNLTTLAKAYNVVPDLRTPQLELGFSVNLEWQNGYEFEINI